MTNRTSEFHRTSVIGLACDLKVGDQVRSQVRSRTEDPGGTKRLHACTLTSNCILRPYGVGAPQALALVLHTDNQEEWRELAIHSSQLFGPDVIRSPMQPRNGRFAVKASVLLGPSWALSRPSPANRTSFARAVESARGFLAERFSPSGNMSQNKVPEWMLLVLGVGFQKCFAID